MPGKGGGIGPHNCIQPRAPKNFNPALCVDYIDIDSGSTIIIQWAKVAIFKLYAQKYLANGK